MPREYLPQTILQEELAKEINSRLEPGLRVSFHRWRDQETMDPQNRITFYFHGRSKSRTQIDDFFDVPGIVREIKAWRASLDMVSERYTTEIPEGFFDGPVGTTLE